MPGGAEHQRQYNTIMSDSEEARVEEQNQRQYCYRQSGNAVHLAVHFCSLATASYIGVLCRVYLGKLAKWNGIPLFPSLYSEIVGTLIMRFCYQSQDGTV